LSLFKSVFHIPKMDCHAEENLIRLQLEELSQVKSLQFDLQLRQLEVFHTQKVAPIEKNLCSLNLGSKLTATIEVENDALQDNQQQKQLLYWVLLINLGFFFVELGAGWWSQSMGLIADSLDMLADALVYALSLGAVAGTMARKKKVARWAGYLQLSLAALGFIEVLRRFFGPELMPDFKIMIGVSLAAAVANGTCLYILNKAKNKDEAHLKASLIFTSNDLLLNLGVVVAALLVQFFSSNLPDLIIGSLLFAYVSQAGFRILKLGKT
jgi:Co/Zn/Cd efflux system component